MSDQCRHCTEHGDIDGCRAIECNRHESWYATTQQREIEDLKDELRIAAINYANLTDAMMQWKARALGAEGVGKPDCVTCAYLDCMESGVNEPCLFCYVSYGLDNEYQPAIGKDTPINKNPN